MRAASVTSMPRPKSRPPGGMCGKPIPPPGGPSRSSRARSVKPYSTVTVLARFRGWSTFSPLMPAMW